MSCLACAYTATVIRAHRRSQALRPSAPHASLSQQTLRSDTRRARARREQAWKTGPLGPALMLIPNVRPNCSLLARKPGGYAWWNRQPGELQ